MSETDNEKISRVYEHGREIGLKVLDDLRKFLNQQ